MPMNDADLRNALARLPKWAQARIEDLERKLAEMTRRVAELSAGPEDSDVYVHDYVYPDRPLGKGVQVAFVMTAPGPHGRPDVITVQHSRDRPGKLDVHCVSDHGAVSVYASPVVSNHIRLSLGEA